MAVDVKNPSPKEEKPLEKMTVKELRQLALEYPRERSVQEMDKSELLAFLRACRDLEAKTEEPSPAPPKEKRAVSPQALKARIRELKAQRASLEGKKQGGKAAGLLRRRISRLKKRSRRAKKA